MSHSTRTGAVQQTTSDPLSPTVSTPRAGGLGTRRNPAAMRVTDVRRISNGLLHLGLAREDGGTFTFRPGQFCRMAVPVSGGDPVWRSYSIATPTTEGSPNEFCEVAVAARPDGVATEYLFGLGLGDRVWISGPFGRLVLPEKDPAHYLFIGTGTGMAPYRAMLPELERRARAAGGTLRVTLLMGVREPAEALYVEDFFEFAARAPEMRSLLVSYSRRLPDEPGWFEAPGHVQDRLTQLHLSPADDRVLLCGNPAMIDDCFAALTARGFDKTAIVREKYLPG